MKLYYPKSHYDKSARGALFPLLKPFIKSKRFTDDARIKMYHLSEKDFDFSESLADADLAILTMSWNYYVAKNKEALAIDFVQVCEKQGKKVMIWNSGDHGVKIPDFDNAIIFRESGYRSQFRENEHSLPSFISDPLKKYYQTKNIFELPYTQKPIVGFCGQAVSSIGNAMKELGLIFKRNLRYYTGISKNEPQQILSSSYLRAKVLRYIETSELTTANFIKRDRYRAGVTDNKSTHPTTLEFYDNLKESAYVVCVRGGGNFSVRFYEALAMGRIPVFIDTDSSLPFWDTVNWKNHGVWVDGKDKRHVAEKIAAFHQSLSETDFIKLQHANRNLWKEKLTLGGFFKSYVQ